MKDTSLVRLLLAVLLLATFVMMSLFFELIEIAAGWGLILGATLLGWILLGKKNH